MGLVFTSFLLFSKGYSPQHLVYIIPFAILLMPDLRGLAYVLLLTWFNLMEATGYFVMFPHQRWLLVSTVLIRTAAFAALSLEYAAVLGKGRVPARLRGPVFAGWVALSLVAAALSVPALGKAYFQSRLERIPCGELATRLGEQSLPDGAVLVFLDGGLHDGLYPYLPRRVPVYLLPQEPLSAPSLAEERARFLARLRAGYAVLLVVTDRENPAESEASRWLSGALGEGHLLFEVGRCAVMSYPLK